MQTALVPTGDSPGVTTNICLFISRCNLIPIYCHVLKKGKIKSDSKNYNLNDLNELWDKFIEDSLISDEFQKIIPKGKPLNYHKNDVSNIPQLAKLYVLRVCSQAAQDSFQLTR